MQVRSMIRYRPSERALRQLELRRLAELGLSHRKGGLVSGGELTRGDVNLLANLGLGCYVPVCFLAPANRRLEHLVQDHRERGYWCQLLEAEAILRQLPAEPYPFTVAFLHLRGGEAEELARSVQALEPLLEPGSVVVHDRPSQEPGGRRTGGRHGDQPGELASLDFEPLPTEHPELLAWRRLSVEKQVEEQESTGEPGSQTVGPDAEERPFTVLAYPSRPGGKFSYMCRAAGYRLVQDPREPFDLAMKWHPQTYTLNDAVLEELQELTPVLNVGCEDISKRRVEEAHRRVFGYGLVVDARTYRGTCVQKANLNAQNREYVVECPQPEADQELFVYQRLVTTPTEPEEYEEYRVAITGDRIPLVVIKRRSVEERFDRSAGYAVLAAAEEVFSAAEQSKIFELCRNFRFEFGDLDILRDRTDGRIYVIDVNPTPGGPGGGYTGDQRRRLVEIQLEALRGAFIRGRDGHAAG